MIDPSVTELRKLSELPFLTDDVLSSDIFLVTHLGESFKVTKSQLFVDIKEKTYIHDQMIPASIWTINHNLNQEPSVTVVDSGGTVVFGEVIYLNNNIIRLEFSAGFSGKAYLN